MSMVPDTGHEGNSPKPDSLRLELDSDCWDVTLRIAASEHFSKSELLPKFLLYICDRELRGFTEEITEHRIGVQVFNRPPGYNPGDDNIVRNYAGQLRKRLDLYYAGEGAHESIRIKIPRGGYVPVFQRPDPLPSTEIPTTAEAYEKAELVATTPVESVEEESSIEPASPLAPSPRNRDWKMFLVGFGLCAALFFLFFALFTHWHTASFRSSSPSSPLWSAIFTKDRETFIVPADSGLGILQNLTEQKASLADYISGKYLSDINLRSMDPSNLDDLRSQRYTSIADVDIISKLSRLPEIIPDRYEIRFARDLRIDDLQDGNAILLGAIHSDPWVELLQKQLNFQFVCELHVNHCSIVNTNPAGDERKIYENESQKPSHTTYGVLAFTPNLNHTGVILLIEGLNVAATQAAADTVLDEATMDPILKQAIQPNGKLRPFELLIQTTSVDAAPLPPQVIAMRFER